MGEMNDKPMAKPIQAWAMKKERGGLSLGSITTSKEAIDDLVLFHDSPEWGKAETVPITVTEGHGDELERVQRDIAREIRDWMESDVALCGPDPFDLEQLAQRIERGEI